MGCNCIHLYGECEVPESLQALQENVFPLGKKIRNYFRPTTGETEYIYSAHYFLAYVKGFIVWEKYFYGILRRQSL